jgi:hypothetical protein
MVGVRGWLITHLKLKNGTNQIEFETHLRKKGICQTEISFKKNN